MATSPLGGFVDLSQYAQAAAQPAVSPLDALIQGFGQGQQIAQLPQQIANKAAAQQLELLIQQANLAKLQRPQAINTSRGVLVEDPTVPGGFKIVPGTQPVAATRASTSKLYTNPTTQQTDWFAPGAQPEGFQAVVSGRGTSGGGSGTPKLYVNPQTNDSDWFVPGTQPEGFQAYTGKGSKSSSGASGGGGDLKPTGEEVRIFSSSLGLLNQIDKTLQAADKYEKEGKFPNALQSGLDQFLKRRPEDIPGAGLVPGFDSAFATAQKLARGAQTKEAADLQKRKAMISSTILRTQAGLSQTLGEAINIAPYVPSENDTYESLVEKLRLTQETGRDALRIQRRIFPALASVAAPELDELEESVTQVTPPSPGPIPPGMKRQRNTVTGEIRLVPK